MKPITERIDSIEINKSGINWNYNKNTIVIWGYEKNVSYPIAFIHKPKGISLEDWQVIKKNIKIELLR